MGSIPDTTFHASRFVPRPARMLIRVYVDAGNRSAALEQFHRLRAALVGVRGRSRAARPSCSLASSARRAQADPLRLVAKTAGERASASSRRRKTSTASSGDSAATSA